MTFKLDYSGMFVKILIVNCFIKVYGCQMNAADSSLLSGILAGAGITETLSEKDAESVVVLTCSVRQHAEDRAKGFARTMRGEGKKVVVAGCMAQLRGDSLIREGVADYVAGPDQYRMIPSFIKEQEMQARNPDFDELETYSDLLPSFKNSVSESLAIMRGCNNYCSYCVVPYARGPERSVPYQSIERRIRRFLDCGAKEVFLLGQNVLAYGDAGKRFIDLLERLSGLSGLERIGFLTSHPRDLDKETVRRMAAIPNLLHFFHLPLQSASDKVLSLMNRGYTMADYEERVAWVRETFEKPYITTDILVGFPGETQEDFQYTLDAIERIGFDFAYMFAYSERPGTRACEMSAKVSQEERQERLCVLIEHANAIARKKASCLVGSEEEIFITAPAPRGDGAMLAGLRNHRSIVFKQKARPGERLRARIVRLEGFTLLAEPLTKDVV